MKRCIYLIGLFALVFTLIFSIASLFSSEHLMFDLVSHFKAHYAIAACVLFVLFCRIKSLAFLSIGLLVFNLAFVLPWYFGSKEMATKEDIKLLLSNVLISNNNYGSFISLVQNEIPGIIVVMEINEAWVGALHALKKDYSCLLYTSPSPRDRG